jgi:glycogen operon protein
MSDTAETVRGNLRIWPGKPYPLGANYDGAGTNFSLFSEVAEKVELCIFDDEGRETRIPLEETTGFCHHCYLPDIGPNTRYGYRVHGPWEPSSGLYCNPAKLLLDPYTKAVDGQVEWDEAVFPYVMGSEEMRIDEQDSAPFLPRGVVHNPFFDWSGDRPLNIPINETVIYEVHVKGFSARHPDVPPEIRSTYTALAHPAAIDHLTSLGITTLELMPVHQFIHDKHLVDRGLRNYWGYNTIGFFAPHNEYASDRRPQGQVAEFKQMVKTLHQAGIEVILDVVYNHTAEGNHLGPMLSFRGIDNAAYYRRMPENSQYYMDYTGTGNSLNVRHPHVLQLIMDSLRYWVLEMHVDGFRFDLAAALARELHDVDRLSAFFDIIQQDPVVSQVKLIAEPWDVGEGGYQVGNFPTLWSEWNGKYRDTVSTGTPCVISGAGRTRPWGNSPPASPGAAISTSSQAEDPTPASTSSPPTTVSPCGTWSPTARSTTRPTARRTGTVTTTTAPGTAERRVRRTTPTYVDCGTARSGIS